jgi:hypothetical protein
MSIPLNDAHRLHMDDAHARWQNGTQRIELYVDGMTHEDFMQAMACNLMSRKMASSPASACRAHLRDYRMYGRFDEASVTVDYMPFDADR